MAKKEQTFEENLHELEKIIATIECGEASLEELTKLYKRGIELQKTCRDRLEKAKMVFEELEEK